MTSIEVINLQKTFQTQRKAAGLSGPLRALIKPEYSSIEAVQKLSFQMETGELLGFIEPNGAVGFFTLAIFIFNAGLRRYKSGSAIQIEV